MTSQDVLHFWFEECEPKKHWQKDPSFDELIRQRFGELHQAASRCELFAWRVNAEGRLAEIIVLDQFSRNLFRDRPESFSQDALALALAQEAILSKADQELTMPQLHFLYMPFMHSESAAIHEIALELFTKAGSAEYEQKHKAIIDRFGRYPHRNAILNRQSTPAEIEFLKGPNSSF